MKLPEEKPFSHQLLSVNGPESIIIRGVVTMGNQESTGFISSKAGELFYEIKGVSGKTPLIAVHGGPGFTSYYLEPLFDVASSFQVVCYDQAGCGRARRSGGRTIFSMDGFIDELEELRIALGFERIHVLGHSYGGAIAIEYALAHPERVSSLICACASLDIPRWLEDAERLLSRLPLMSKMIIREGLRTGNYSSPQFLDALTLYYERHIYGFKDKPLSIIRAEAEADAITYQRVWGPNELVVNGLARSYSLSHRLSELACPVLYLCGRHDEATPEAHAYFASRTPSARLEVFEHSAHHPQITERDAFLALVREFILSCEAAVVK